MYGDPREAIEVTILGKLEALTTADGLPQAFRLVTREMVHLEKIKPAQLPCAFLQFEEPDTVPMLSRIIEVTLPGRIVVGFPGSSTLPATAANAYRAAIERMLMADRHLGGLVDMIQLRGTLMPGLWEPINLLGLGVLFSVQFEYDPGQPAVTA